MHVSVDFPLFFGQFTRVRAVQVDEEILREKCTFPKNPLIPSNAYLSLHFNSGPYQSFHFYVPYVILGVLYIQMKTLPDAIFTEVDPGNQLVIINALTNIIDTNDTNLENVQSQGQPLGNTAHIAPLRLDFGSIESHASGDSTAHCPGTLFRLWKSQHHRGVVCVDHPNAVLLECRFSIEPAGCRYDEMEMEGTDCAK